MKAASESDRDGPTSATSTGYLSASDKLPLGVTSATSLSMSLVDSRLGWTPPMLG